MKQPNKLYILFLATLCSISTISYGMSDVQQDQPESKAQQALAKAKEIIAKTPATLKHALQSKLAKATWITTKALCGLIMIKNSWDFWSGEMGYKAVIQTLKNDTYRLLIPVQKMRKKSWGSIELVPDENDTFKNRILRLEATTAKPIVGILLLCNSIKDLLDLFDLRIEFEIENNQK